MARTYSQLVSAILQMLQDTAVSVWEASEIDTHLTEAINEISNYHPVSERLTCYTTANSREISLSPGEKYRLIGIERAEYPVDNYPRLFRNVERWGDTVWIDVRQKPTADNEEVYLYIDRAHRLQKEVGTSDLAATLANNASQYDTSLDLKDLGTGSIKEGTKLTISGDNTVYHVIEESGITSNTATVSIYPEVAQDASSGTSVILALSESTLNNILETILVYLVAGNAAISKSTHYMNTVNVGAGNVGEALQKWGMNMLKFARSELYVMSPPVVYADFSRE